MIKTSRVPQNYFIPNQPFMINKPRDFDKIKVGMVGCISMTIISKMSFNSFMVVDKNDKDMKLAVIIPRIKTKDNKLIFGQDRSIFEASPTPFQETSQEHEYQVHHITYPHKQKMYYFDMGNFIEDEKNLISW